jgi:ABC-type multidrug transport system fused ATPase/permease subunit
MEYYQEENEDGAKLYNRDVLRLLFSYILRYRSYLAISLFLVLFISGSSLAVPFLFKTIIDRYIFKQGRVVNTTLLPSGMLKGTPSLVRNSPELTETETFLFRSDLKLFSSKEKEWLFESGALSSESYIYIENSSSDTVLSEKIMGFVQQGAALQYDNGVFLFDTSIVGAFKVSELALLRQADFKRIVHLILVIVAILLLQFGATYMQILLLMRLSQNAMRDLRRDLFSHILSREVTYYDQNPIGKLVNRVTNDIERLNELFSSVLVTLFQDVLMLLGITLIMFLTSVNLALIVAISFPFLTLLIVLFRLQARNAYRKIRTKISELNSFLNETITGIRIVQIFVREVSNFQKFARMNDRVYKSQMGQLYVNAVFRPLIGFMRWFAIASVIYFGASGIVQDRISFGLLVMFIAYIERFFRPIHDLSEKFDIMQSATAAGEKIISVLHEKGKIEQRSTGRNVSHGEPFMGRIEFRDVWFSYKPEEWVLRGVSFVVEPRQTLAIVGETGAGKSTIINILSRFYDVQRGKVLIDGKDIRDIPFEIVRSLIVTVMQDVFLFSRSLRENIILGRNFDEERFSSVSRITHIDGFIKTLPQGMDEPVMERGATFSAGQRQLISFARALYADPAILVLDEATSSIDTETERLIQDAIIGLMQGRTSIVVAHRLSTIKHADKILVLDRGRIADQGDHDELMRRGGLYRSLYTLQFDALT